jgi:hypothetical protein
VGFVKNIFRTICRFLGQFQHTPRYIQRLKTLVFISFKHPYHFSQTKVQKIRVFQIFLADFDDIVKSSKGKANLAKINSVYGL